MAGAYRDSTDTLRARADALQLENVMLKARLRRLEGQQGKLARKGVIAWLTGALLVVVLLGFAGVLLGSCLSVLGSAFGGIQ